MSIVGQDGFRGLYRGLGPTIFGYLPTWAIYFTVYDKVKLKMGELRGQSFNLNQVQGFSRKKKEKKLGQDDTTSLDL